MKKKKQEKNVLMVDRIEPSKQQNNNIKLALIIIIDLTTQNQFDLNYAI